MDTEALGEWRFRTRKSLWWLLAWCAPLVGVWLLLFVWAAEGNIRNITGNEIAIGIIILLIALILMIDFLTIRIDVYSDALVYRHWFRRTVVRFSPYMQLYVRRWCYGALMFTRGRFCALEWEEDGCRHRISASFRHNERIAAVMEQYLFRTSMHMLNQIYDAGEVLHFGAVQLSRQHISINGKALPAEQVGRYHISAGQLKIYQTDKKWRAAATVPISQIANFRLLCRFIHLNDVGMNHALYRTRRPLLL